MKTLSIRDAGRAGRFLETVKRAVVRLAHLLRLTRAYRPERHYMRGRNGAADDRGSAESARGAGNS
jgi:hypothetical protein